MTRKLRRDAVVIREENSPGLADAVRRAVRRAGFGFEKLRRTKGLLSPYTDVTTRGRVRLVKLEVLARALGTTAEALIADGIATPATCETPAACNGRDVKCDLCKDRERLRLLAVGRGLGVAGAAREVRRERMRVW